MNKAMRIGIVVALLAVIGVVLAMKANKGDPSGPSENGAVQTPTAMPSSQPLPRLVDLGASTCIPCKMMEPVLQELRQEYAGRFQVEFYDVWQHPEYKERYGVRMIPTQVFYSADGKELWRHEGFMAKEDILDKWKELGVDITGGEAAAPAREQ